MDMQLYLLKLEIYGIKNIKSDITIEFYKKTIANDFDPSLYKVKGIYGENGSGKTAIVTSVSILRNLILNNHYLSDSNTQRKLLEIINKSTRRCRMAIEFYAEIGDIPKIYRYEVALAAGDDGWISIEKEKLLLKEGRYSKNSFNLIYEVVRGKFTELKGDNVDSIIEKTNNLLSNQTLMSMLTRLKYDNALVLQSIVVYLFALTVQIYMDESDHHSNYFLTQRLKELLNTSLNNVLLERKENRKESKYLFDSGYYNSTHMRDWDSLLSKTRLNLVKDMQEILSIKSNDTVVSKNRYEEYEKKVHRLYEFLKVFKSDLRSIEIDKREEKNFYRCNLIMVYDDYKLDKEFESRGIKKLAEMFDYLDSASDGSIVFIDGLDSNVNDVYLDTIIEYLMYYGKGQLCFTAHNLSPMSVLKQNKASITFISNINTVHTWTSRGNMNPENAYRNGFIEDSPFNVQPSDFIGILGREDE